MALFKILLVIALSVPVIYVGRFFLFKIIDDVMQSRRKDDKQK